MLNADHCGLETTALCIHPPLDSNANDVAHVAAFPPAATRHGR